MALTKINNNTLSAITGLPAGVGGKVLQVVRNYVPNTSLIESTSTSFTASGIQASITPSASGNLILVDYICGLSQAVDSGTGDAIKARMYQKIGTGSMAAMSGSNEFQIAYVYDLGNEAFSPMVFNGSYTSTNTDTLIFEPYFLSQSGGNVRFTYSKTSYSLTLTEIAQ